MENKYCIGVTLFRIIPGFLNFGGHEHPELFFGAATVEAAREEARKYGESMAGSQKATYRAAFYEICQHCKPQRNAIGTLVGDFGIEPGFKRKPCTSCRGVVRLPLPVLDLVFSPNA